MEIEEGGHGLYLKRGGLHLDRTTPFCVFIHCSADSWLSHEAVCLPPPPIWFKTIEKLAEQNKFA